jgi:hypothetical protein
MLRNLNQLRQRKTVCADPKYYHLSLLLYKTVEVNNQVEIYAGEGLVLFLEDDTVIFDGNTGDADYVVSPPEPTNTFSPLIIPLYGGKVWEMLCAPLSQTNKYIGLNSSTNQVQEPCKTAYVRQLRIASFTRLR